jgi:putative Mn2+ efflux pump MntP
MLALVLVAASVGFSNLAASIGVGAGGIDWGTRLRIVMIFGTFEAGMPIVGLLVGHDLAGAIGRETRWLAAVLLVAVGCYGILNAWRLGRRGAGPADPVPRDPTSADHETGNPGPAERSAVGGRGPRGGRGLRGGRRQSIQLLVSGLALSLDNLVAGFALGAYQVNIVVGAVVFGVVSVAMSLAGLEFGARIGGRAGLRGEVIGNVILIGVGVAIGFGVVG